MSHKVLFLCTGNYYRSRFAEMLFNALASRKDLDWTADSRGLATRDIQRWPGLSRRSRSIEDAGISGEPNPDYLPGW